MALAVGAVGVVFGDIGTSPLYAFKEAFGGSHNVPLTHDNVLGVLSLMVWSLFLIVTVKYVIFMMRADNRGEGGIMALIALVRRTVPQHTRLAWTLTTLGMVGAALFYGDGMITPAISVLSAVEGLDVATPLLHPYIIPITLVILTGLFLFQQLGTGSVGALFGPIMLVWFVVLAVLGLINIADQPSVLASVNPGYAVQFFRENRWAGFLALGAVVLAVTGAEALYADMGHFGKQPIRLAWLWLVFPSLLLNYMGQGALVLHQPAAIQHPFFHSAPDWALYPLVILATVATVIASQAVISGAYSLTRQAIQLGYCPRLMIEHTSEKEIGQVYLPWVNWGLYLAVAGLVLGFGSSSNLAGAYGIAVTGTMVATAVLAYVVVRRAWGWSLWRAIPVFAVLLTIDLAFLSANLLKIFEGGWFPLVVGAIVFVLLATWTRGREILFDRLRPGAIALEPFIRSITEHPPVRVPGTAVFLTASQEGVPHALLHNLNHNKVLHERVVLLTVRAEDIPHVGDAQRVHVEPLGHSFYRLTVRYGFKDEPDLPRALELAKDKGLEFSLMETSFFLSRQTLVPTEAPGMALWREKLFAAMSRNSASATAFFRIPTNRVVELGTRIEL
ncbi:MAG TPA: potassium transporter Kup [Burkholderiales bacterium]|nr:potassium transporter Kup [Burkholderiales bacterium]